MVHLNGEGKWVDTVKELMDAVDSWIEIPPRDNEKPFLMSVEDVFSITGRGTVATGRIETGVINTGDEVDILLVCKKKSLSLYVQVLRCSVRSLTEVKRVTTLVCCYVELIS